MPTQSTDVSGSTYGIEYNSPGQTWKIKKGVSVVGNDTGVYSEYVNSKLVNNGTVVGQDDYGVYFDADGGFSKYEVMNKKKGEINADDQAIYLYDFRGSALIDNYGAIISSEDEGVHTYGSSNVMVNNWGSIYGEDQGVYIDSEYVGTKAPSIKNYGKIESQGEAIYLYDDTGMLAKIVNYEKGVIRGDDYAIYSEERVKIKNDGKILGDIQTEDYDDKVINKKKIKGNVELGEGDDTLKNKDKGKTTGLIDSEYGNDKLTLGNKTEKLLFDSTLNSNSNVDRIKMFESGKDMMYLDEDYFSSLTVGPLSNSEFRKGTVALDSDDYIIYDKKNGGLYYDYDGVGGDAKVKFAQLDPNTKLKASDFEVGEFSI